MAMPTSDEMMLFDTDLTLAGRVARAPLKIALEHDRAALADEKAVEAREFAGSRDGRVERRRDCFGRTLFALAHCAGAQQSQGDNQESNHGRIARSAYFFITYFCTFLGPTSAP